MKVKSLVLMVLIFAGHINASPTSNEFVPCKKIAVAKLEYCLMDDDKNCWSESKASYESCRKDVIQQHIPNYDRIKKMKDHRNELEIKGKEK